MSFDAATLKRLVLDPRWSALTRTGLDLAAITRIDPSLLRETRVLVPMDVQALYVPPGQAEPSVRIRLALAAPDGQDPAHSTAILDDDTPREGGVHLHWALPDALLRGTLAAQDGSNRLQLPPLPDRFVVLRLMVPRGASAPLVHGWVVEADKARAVPLDQWPDGAPAIEPSGREVPLDEFNGSCGGSLNWTAVYDATLNRFALHDDLADLPTLAPRGLEGDQASYLVAGWWSEPARDPLDGAHTDRSLTARLNELRWVLMEDREGADAHARDRATTLDRQAAFGVPVAARYAMAPVAQGVAGLGAGSAQAVRGVKTLQPAASVFAEKARTVRQSEPSWPRSTLLHGIVYGVPVRPGRWVDNRPDAAEVDVVWGAHDHDVAATLAGSALAPNNLAERRNYERLLAAFTGHLVDRIGTADGVADVEQWEHAAAFASLPGGHGGTDRLLDGGDGAALGVGRQARAAEAARQRSRADSTKASADGSRLSFATDRRALKVHASKDEQRAEMARWDESGSDKARRGDRETRSEAPAPRVREVERPAPRWFLPTEPMVTVRGAARSLRHGGDGRMSQDGKLRCRWPSQVIRGIDQVVGGSELLPSLGSAALPDEVLLLAREALLHNPWLTDWLAAQAANLRGGQDEQVRTRVRAEAALRFGSTQAVYDGTSGAFSRMVRTAGGRTREITDDRIGDQLRRFSLVRGMDPDPVGVTAWSQPWVPLWLEWELTLDVEDTLQGWSLGSIDWQPRSDAEPPVQTRVFVGRSVLTTSTGRTLSAAMLEWMNAENLRDAENRGEADESTEAALGNLATAVSQLDLVSASLDGLREQLMGLSYNGGVIREKAADGTLGLPRRSGLDPLWLVAGRAQLSRARLVDAFGRVLALPLGKLQVPQRRTVAEAPGALAWPPRMNTPARLLLRLVDPAVPASAAATAAEATVDQATPARMVNPVAGFVLPDHIDESLEFFDIQGRPVGQLMHDAISGGVTWEIAPGRSGPADAGPLFELGGGARHLGHLAAGVVAVDARTRGGQALGGDDESALSALLRAIDTTMWSVDPLQGLGTEHIAGLVGRPLALVRLRVSLELQAEHGFDAAALTAALADRAFHVRIGEITRSDDSVLGYFIDDDYEHLHVVDRVVAAHDVALDTRRQQGQLGSLDSAPVLPPTRPITHPYVVSEDEIELHLGTPVMLTVLMHPAGKLHASCGVVPRKSIQLARDWVAPALAVMAPSARVGPVLVDPSQVRLPKISAFPKDQLWTRRDSPGTWKDDPILAATQEALLPDLPHEVQEGWIRIAPEKPPGGGTGA